VLDAGGPYLGPPAADPALDAILDGLARAAPHTVLLYPVVVRERVAAVLYADNGEAPVSPRRVGDLLMLAASVGAALERILVSAKRAGSAAPAAAPPAPPPAESWEAREPARAPAPPPEPPTPAPEAALDLSAPEEHYQVAPAAEALAAALAFEPEAGVARLVASARGSAERGRLVALLVQHGPEAAAALAQAFPGPIDPRVAAQEESLPAGERGPVLMALAALGIVSTPWLAALLADADPRRRRYAALLLAQLGDPAGFLPLCDRVFDPDPRVAETALAALADLRRQPEFGPVLERLRRALASEAPRPARAARALMALGDAGAVPALAALLDGAPEGAAAAAEALEALTARRFGRDAHAWSAWWRAHRGAARADWLFEALRDPDREVRIAAAEALRAVGPSPVRYFADAPEAERERAAGEWRAWFEQSGLAA
jgi:HEAT repeat protein